MTHSNTSSYICLTSSLTTKLLCISLLNEMTEGNLVLKEFNEELLLFVVRKENLTEEVRYISLF